MVPIRPFAVGQPVETQATLCTYITGEQKCK